MNFSKTIDEAYEWAFLLVSFIFLSAYQWAFPEFLLQNDDTGHYLAAARSFAEQGIFLDSAGDPLHFWPPFFPLILSFFEDPIPTIWIIHFFLAIINILAIRHLSEKFLANSLMRLLFFVLSCLSISHFLIAGFLLTEMLFVSIFLWMLVALTAYREHHNNLYLYLFWVSAFALAMTRQSGLFIILGIAFAYSFSRSPLKGLSIRNVMFYGWPAIGNILWNIKAYFFESNPLRWTDLPYDHIQSGLTLFQKIGIFLFPVHHIHEILAALIAIIVLSLLFFLSMSLSIKSNELLQKLPYLIILYLIGHIFFTNVSFSEADRFIAPMSFLIFLWLFHLAEESLEKLKSNIYRLVFFLLIVVWMTYPLYRSYHNLVRWHQLNTADQNA